jgi:peptide subunit release factor 1 (eRF1)
MTQNNWRTLLSHSPSSNRAILSVFLNVDQSRQANLNRGFVTQFSDMMASLQNTVHDSAELERFWKAAHHMGGFLRRYEVGDRTLVMFFDESDGFFWHQEIGISMPNLARWNRDFFLKPLAAASDDFERYGVALVDRANARLFTVFLGDIEEVAWEGFDATKVRHIKAIGTDRWSSASQIQRRADEQVRKNLRRTVRELDSLMTSNRIDRLLLAGTPELTAELRELLPKRLALRVIGMLDLAIDTPLNDVLDATLPMTEKYERSSEEELVKELVTSAAKTGQAVVGLGSTLKKVNESRVWQLVYSEDFHASGFECSTCAALFSFERETCLYCGAGLVRLTDVVERAVEQAIRKNARIEVVRGEAAASLDNAGGIGAFLKARTKSVTG